MIILHADGVSATGYHGYMYVNPAHPQQRLFVSTNNLFLEALFLVEPPSQNLVTSNPSAHISVSSFVLPQRP